MKCNVCIDVTFILICKVKTKILYNYIILMLINSSTETDFMSLDS